MTKTVSKWHSPRCAQDVSLARWGHWGQPVLLFPTAGGDAEPGSDNPSASPIELIVLAVNMPPQAPSPGQAFFSIANNSSSVIVPAAQAPIASNTDVMSSALPFRYPGWVDPL